MAKKPAKRVARPRTSKRQSEPVRCEERDLRTGWVPIDQVRPHPNNSRKHSRTQRRKLAHSIRRFGWMNPIIIDQSGQIIAGAGRFEAAKQLGLAKVPTVKVEDLSEDEVRAYIIADNRLAQLSEWDDVLLAEEIKHLIKVDVDLALTVGFETPEIDIRIGTDQAASSDEDDVVPDVAGTAITRVGDLWLIGPHRLLCADSRDASSVARVLGDKLIRLVVEDRPYNVPVQGHVSGLGRRVHREFAMASGEMTPEEFQTFLEAATAAYLRHLMPGSLIYEFIDWAHLEEMLAAQRTFFNRMHNLAIWVKTNAGMGSHYRSQHELCCIHKHGSEPHVNNVQLGRCGRYRSNVWIKAGANTFRKGRDEDLNDHPTVKPTSLIGDIILDSSNPKDRIFDGFIGSGTTLLACERTGRVGCGIEIDPIYVDVALRRLAAATGLQARLDSTGQSLSEVASDRNINTSKGGEV